MRWETHKKVLPDNNTSKWNKLEKIAAEYKLKLVAPVLNFTGDLVGGRTWTPYEWLDEFIKQYRQKYKRLPKMDCLALHCYMNWYGASTWFTLDYFYRDLYDANNESYGKYPNIVALMDDYKASHGHFPRMMLTEFCSWEGDKEGFVTTRESQIDQMTQKIQKMEQSDLVEGYAWFMANGNASRFPFFSIFETNWPDSELSDLGKVYVHMSSFDKEQFYAPGNCIQAKDYVDATTDNTQVKLRPNTEENSNLPLQVEFQAGSSAVYQVTVPQGGTCKFVLHLQSAAETALALSIDGEKAVTCKIASTASQWQDMEVEAALTEGRHTIRMSNDGTASFIMNSWSFEVAGQ